MNVIADNPVPYEELVRVVRGRRVVALTGAGISTESGIPDYRGEGTAVRARNPIQHAEFIRQAATRQRYWARSFVGWPRFSSAHPNAGHTAVATLERAGVIAGVITQNVDRLHHRAGSDNIVELHGALHEARCLDCELLEDRDALQVRLARLNDGWGRGSGTVAPDGDVELDDEHARRFTVATCLRCDGTLMPNVVFFGGSVPRPVVDRAWALLDCADVLLVVGSSLTVFSGFRFVRRAAQQNLPIVIVNLGPTRGDDLATVRIKASSGKCLSKLAGDLVRDPVD